jgi:hypothetical protein
VDSARYYVHKLIGSWGGMSLRDLSNAIFVDPCTPGIRLLFDTARVYLWHTAHVRVLAFLLLDAAGVALILLNLTKEEELRRGIQRRC